ncbi:hypothetical protein DERP_011623 [Dermatophagoides pteronyssinus]|uniref:Uncharacterized protein n=1 Tax=Dermatophagoides pteronyssinus TaxID=6956 RepID=A0ABQ8JWF7_DERPT|nr:hypothetical protein DERP_011623 [Dermatophagoides pteronyssinus]
MNVIWWYPCDKHIIYAVECAIKLTKNLNLDILEFDKLWENRMGKGFFFKQKTEQKINEINPKKSRKR